MAGVAWIPNVPSGLPATRSCSAVLTMLWIALMVLLWMVLLRAPPIACSEGPSLDSLVGAQVEIGFHAKPFQSLEEEQGLSG